MHTLLETAVSKLKSGEQKYFDLIYDKTFKLVYFSVFRILNNKTQTEDIVQETYITAFKNINKYQSDSFTAWLITIAKNLAINFYNKNKRESVVDFQENADFFGSYEIPGDDSSGVFEIASRVLEENDYQILVMYAVSGYKRREIAEVLKIPVSTVSWRYKKILDIMRIELEKVNEDV